MATYYSPKIITDGLVLCLDAGNVKSFRGEPTVNYYSTPETLTNGRIGATSGGTYTDYVTGGPSDGKFTRWTNNTGSVGSTAWHWEFSYSNTGLTTGQQLNVSFYARRPNGTLSNITLNSPDSVAVNAGLTTEWQRFNAVITYGGDYTSTPFVRINRSNSNASTLGATYDIALVQIETKTYATTFTTGTRGATVATGGGWADLSQSNNNGELVNGVKQNSSNGGNVLFDGVDDYISTPITGTFSQITFDYWGFYDDVTLNTKSRNESAFGDWTANRIHWGTRWSVGMHWNVNNSWAEVPTTNLRYGWNHFSLVWNNVASQKLIYINNILSLSQATNGNLVLGDFRIGVATNLGAYYRGNISNFKVYNRALSASEISANYNATKTRYGL